MGANRTDKEFDDLLRKRFEGHSIGPDRALWEGINTRLYQKRIDSNIHRVKQLRIAISAVAAILTGVVVYSIFKTTDNKPDIQITSEIPVTRPSSENVDKIETMKQNNLQDEEPVRNLIKSTHEKINPESIKGKKEIIKETLAIDDRLSDQVVDSSSIQPGVMTASEFHDTLTLLNADIQPIVDSILPDQRQSHSSKINEHLASVLPGSLISDMNVTKDTMGIVENTIIPVPEKSSQNTIKFPEVQQSFDQVGKLTLTDTQIKHTCFFIEAFVMPEFSYRALLTNPKYIVPDYDIAYFNKTEKSDFTFSAGISGGFRMSDKLILKSGVFYSRYSFKFRTEAFYLLNTSTGGNLVYTSSGPVTISLLSSDTLSNESFIKSSIKFSYVNIPVIVELHLRYNYFINLGINLNMLACQNMNWQAEDYDGNFTETVADPIEGIEFGGMSMIIGLGKEKYITRQLSVLINPSVRINLTSINNTSPVKSYPYSWGLNAGLRYYFD